jgi:hypothetical protein
MTALGVGSMALAFVTLLPVIGGCRLLLAEPRPNQSWLDVTIALWLAVAAAVLACTLGVAAVTTASGTIQGLILTVSSHAISDCVRVFGALPTECVRTDHHFGPKPAHLLPLMGGNTGVPARRWSRHCDARTRNGLRKSHKEPAAGCGSGCGSGSKRA